MEHSKIFLLRWGPILFLFGLSACGGQKGTVANTGNVSDQNVAMSVANTVGSAARTMEPAVTTGSSLVSSSTVDVAALCSANQSPSPCSKGASTVTYNNCSTQGSSAIDGKWIHTFSPAQACDVHTSSRVLVQNSTLVKTAAKQIKISSANGQVILSSDPNKNFDGTSYSGGISMTSSAGTSALTVLGLNKRVSNAQGSNVSDYSLHSDGYPISVSGSRASGNRAANGFITVTDNSQRANLSVTLENVIWGSPLCCYPTSGKIKIDHPGSQAKASTNPVSANSSSSQTISTSTLTFSEGACGTAVLSSGNSHTQVVMSLCEE